FPVAQLDDGLRARHRRHDQRAVRLQEPVDRLQPVPRPRLHAFAQRIVDGDANVGFLGLVLGHPFLQSLVVGSDDGEVLGGNAVALGAVTVAAEGDAGLAIVLGGQYDPAADVLGQVLLKDPTVHDLYCEEAAHSYPPTRDAFDLSNTCSISSRCFRIATSAASASRRRIASRMRRWPASGRCSRPATWSDRSRLSRNRSISTSSTRRTTRFRAAVAIA